MALCVPKTSLRREIKMKCLPPNHAGGPHINFDICDGPIVIPSLWVQGEPELIIHLESNL